MMNIQPEDFTKAIQKAIQREIENIIQDEAKEAAVRVEKKVRELAPALACTLLDKFTFEKFGTELRITVEFKKEGPK